MTGARTVSRRFASLSRRRLLLGAAAGAGAAAVAGAGIHAALGAGKAGQAPVPDVPLGAQPAGLPVRQHAWDAYLAADPEGNPVSPKFGRLLFFDVNGAPSPAYARLLEAALRTLERGYPWRPSGLLFTAAWGPGYFRDVLGVAAPVPSAMALSDFEQPLIDDYHLCLHLASDDESRLAAIEAALTRGTPLPAAGLSAAGLSAAGLSAAGLSAAGLSAAGLSAAGLPAAGLSAAGLSAAGAAGQLDISRVLRWRQSRTGFVGTGLPAGHQDVNGIPAGQPVPKGAPLFMGFKSALRRNQASEDDVTIPDGPFAGGTTMHVSYLRLRLGTWYGQLSQRERVARMYAPQVTPEQVSEFTTDAESDPNLLGQAITGYGVIGHAQTCARARRAGSPVILRRDFDTTDGGLAGLHFVSLQRTSADFVTTRTAMNATGAGLQNPSITDTVNNGINEFIFVLRRGNYVVPARSQRSFPLLPPEA